jgi:signal transduction histidine kinase
MRRSTPVRLAAFYLIAFITSFFVAGMVAITMIEDSLQREIDTHVLEKFREIENTFNSRGIVAAINMVDDHSSATEKDENIYFLGHRANEKLAGNIRAPASKQNGFSDYFSSTSTSPEATKFRAYTGKLGDLQFSVGSSFRQVEGIRKIALMSFGWASAIVLAFGIAGAAWLAGRTGRRLREISQAIAAVGEGELAARIPISARNDDIDLLSREVNKALAKLEGSVNSIRHITSNIAHDLRKPLGRIYITLESALENPGARGTVSDDIETALCDVRELAVTFESILGITEIEANGKNDRFELVRLDEIARQVFEIYLPVCEDCGHTLNIIGDQRSAAVRGDSQLLKQLVINLVENAIRHTPDGSHISIGYKSDLTTCWIGVSDDGPGIPGNEKTKVFERFYRLERSKSIPGSGLGLSMVKAIVDLHGADVELLDQNPGITVGIIFPTK